VKEDRWRKLRGIRRLSQRSGGGVANHKTTKDRRLGHKGGKETPREGSSGGTKRVTTTGE